MEAGAVILFQEKGSEPEAGDTQKPSESPEGNAAKSAPPGHGAVLERDFFLLLRGLVLVRALFYCCVSGGFFWLLLLCLVFVVFGFGFGFKLTLVC